MNHRRTFAVLTVTLAAGLGVNCGPQRVGPHVRPGQDLIALLPDPDDGTIGQAVVSTNAGAAQLGEARAFTTVSPNTAPAPVIVMSEADASQLFGSALSALPPAPQHYMLFFRFESDELTEESRALVPKILQAVKDLPVPDVAIIGHTDTTGAAAGNIALGLRRANVIRGLLIAAAVDAAMIEVTSHGEADPLIKTADEAYEPRNRRVEITVR